MTRLIYLLACLPLPGGTCWIAEIRRLQKLDSLMLPKVPFMHLVREVDRDIPNFDGDPTTSQSWSIKVQVS